MTNLIANLPSDQARLNTWSEFHRLLRERNQHPEQAVEIDRTIRQNFGITCAVMVLDMAGFSKTCKSDGIIAVLAAIYYMNEIVSAMIAAYQGQMIKAEADNVYATFDTVDLAVNAARSIFLQLNTVGIGASIGIGYGEILMIENKEMYGIELNLASKLGEDIAQRNQLLLTETAFDRLTHKMIADQKAAQKMEQTISGLNLAFYLMPN